MDERVARTLRTKLRELEIERREWDVANAKAALAQLQRDLDEAYATRDAINDALLESALPEFQP